MAKLSAVIARLERKIDWMMAEMGYAEEAPLEPIKATPASVSAAAAAAEAESKEEAESKGDSEGDSNPESDKSSAKSEGEAKE